MALLIFLTLIAVPVIEVAVFIEVGGRIGLWPTVGLIVLTALVGTALLRHQGLSTLARARASLEQGKLPMRELLDGVCLLIAGALLLTPGFVTDAVGALLLVPPLRWPLQVWAVRWMMAHGTVTVSATGSVHMSATAQWPPPKEDGVIDGEFTEIDKDDRLPPPPGGKRDR